MLFAINTGFVVSCALSRIGLVRSLGGVAAPVVFDTGLAWSASCKGNLAPPLPPIYPILLDWANLGRLGTPLMSIWLCWASPYLHSLAWPSLCRLGPGASLVVLGDMHDLVQTLQTGPWCQLFPNLAWFSLTDWTPVSVWFV